MNITELKQIIDRIKEVFGEKTYIRFYDYEFVIVTDNMSDMEFYVDLDKIRDYEGYLQYEQNTILPEIEQQLEAIKIQQKQYENNTITLGNIIEKYCAFLIKNHIDK